MPNDTLTYGFIVEAAIGKGRIKTLDTTLAEQAPGVVLVLTHRNAPDQGTGNHREARPMLTGPEVTYFGQPIAFVVAESFEAARSAAHLVRVTYDRGEGKFALNQSIADARTPQAGKEQPQPDSAIGDFNVAFAAAPVQLDVTYTTPLQSHAMMEPHASLAQWDGDKLTLHTANQMLTQSQKAVATTLKIPPENVRLVSPYIGGGFGGKLWVNADAILAAIAARQLGAAGQDRADPAADVPCHDASLGHHPARASGRRSDGYLVAIGHDVVSGNLTTEPGYEGAALQTRTLYAGPNRLTRHRLAALDVPVASSMRAPGEAVGLMALECAMDELAEKLALDPVELRRRNEPTEDPEKHIPYSSRHLIECLDEGANGSAGASATPSPRRSATAAGWSGSASPRARAAIHSGRPRPRCCSGRTAS